MAEGDAESPTLGYADPAVTNRSRPPVDPIASRELVCAVLFFVTPVPAALAIYYGIRGRKQARDRRVRGERRAELAIAMGAIGLIFWALVPFAWAWVHGVQDQLRCQSNMRELGAALNIYAQQNNGIYPQRLQDILSMKVPAGFLVCPSAGIPHPPRGTTNVPTSYVFLAAGMPAKAFKWADVIVFEVSAHSTGNVVVLYGDGHGMLLRPDEVAAEAQKTLAKVASMRAATRPSATRPGV